MKKSVEKKNSERGGAGVKLMIVFLVLYLIGNAGYQWIPAAYNGEAVKQEMHAAILQSMALPPSAGNPLEVTKKRLQRSAAANSLPDDAFIEVKQVSNVIRARIAYTKQIEIIPFGIYTYDYQFDHTATPTGFLVNQ